MRVKRELLAGEWAVLALLCEAPRHGYALAALMAPDGEIGRVWSLRRPMTYRALSSLQKLGLAEIDSVEESDSAPSRTVLRATPDAHAQVEAWLVAPEPHVRDLRSLLLLKIHFLRRRGRSLEPLLRPQRDRLAEQVEALSDRAEGDDELADMLARWRCSMTEAALEFVDEVLRGAPKKPTGAVA
jgi:DNA-binding PadR family transcriptional regulator